MKATKSTLKKILKLTNFDPDGGAQSQDLGERLLEIADLVEGELKRLNLPKEDEYFKRMTK